MNIRLEDMNKWITTIMDARDNGKSDAEVCEELDVSVGELKDIKQILNVTRFTYNFGKVSVYREFGLTIEEIARRMRMSETGIRILCGEYGGSDDKKENSEQ